MAENQTKQNIIIGTVAVVFLWLMIDNIFGISEKRKQRELDKLNAEKGKNVGNSALANLISKGIKPSYDATKYANIAEALYTAMDGIGTANDALAYNLGFVKNDADFLVLQRAFGTRNGQNLLEWLAADIPGYLKKTINDEYRKRGVTYSI